MLTKQQVTLRELEIARKRVRVALIEIIESEDLDATDEIVFSKVLETYLAFCGVSAEELAERWQMHPGTVHRYARNGAKCPLRMRAYRLDQILTHLKELTDNVVPFSSPS